MFEPEDRRITQLGVIGVGLETGSGSPTVYGAGGLFAPVDYAPEALRLVDRCRVYSAESPPPSSDISDYGVLQDAGPQLELEVAGQPFFNLARVNFMGGGYGYTAGEFLGNNIPLPEGTVNATVPGAAFPALSGAFPAAPPSVTGTSAGLTLEDTFTWEPYLPEDAISVLTFQVSPEDFTGVYADCVAADDGSFTLPEATRAELQRLVPDFMGTVVSPSRTVYRVVREGDAALVLSFGDANAPIRYLLGD